MLGRMRARAADERVRAFVDQGRNDLACLRAVELDHDYQHAWSNLGLAYKRAALAGAAHPRRIYPPAAAYLARRRAQGSTGREARRGLKRDTCRRILQAWRACFPQPLAAVA